jgi:PAS domain S-box-containing protein
VLHLSHPLAWGKTEPTLWFPPLGIAVALLAWLGPAAGLLVAADGVLLGLQAWATGLKVPGGAGAGLAVQVLGEAVLTALEAWAAWWAYSRATRGAGHLGDPHSATTFLFVGPGLVVGVAALVRLALIVLTAELAGGGVLEPWILLGEYWAGRALGILSLTPLLLVTATPGLVWFGLVPAPLGKLNPDRTFPGRLVWGDWLEVSCLALATALLGVVLVVDSGTAAVANWRLWGLPLLFIVWASIRQGVQIGTVVAATAAVLCLVTEAWIGEGGQQVTSLQGNLFAQCITALLVGASVSWIRTNEARYRQVVSHIPVVLYSGRLPRWAGDGPDPAPSLPRAEVTFVSPACRALFGCDPAQLEGELGRWVGRVHPEDRELLTAALAQLCLAKEPVTCEYRLASQIEDREPRIDNHPGSVLDPRSPILSPSARWVRDTLVPHVGSDGQVEGWEGVVEDITQQRALAQDLRRTTGMFNALVANLPAGVFFVNGSTGRPILVNTRARQLLGQREDPAAGLAHLAEVYRLHRPDGSPYPPEDLPVSRALRTGETGMRDDIVVHRPDGRHVPLVTWAAPIDLGGHGKPDAAVWVFEDFTAVRQAEAARLQSEARLRAVISTMAEGLVVQDGDGTILECNPAACAILGMSAEQLRGRASLGPKKGCLREDGSPFPLDEQPAMVSLCSGKPVRGVVMGIPIGADERVRLVSAESAGEEGLSVTPAPTHAISLPRVRWVLVNAMPLPGTGKGKEARVVTTFTDITAHRQALEVLRASEERYRGLVESLPLMLVQSDRDLWLTYLNPAAQTVTGYDLAELRRPEAWKAVIHPEDLARVVAAKRDALVGRTGRLDEVRFRAKDGSEKICYAVFQPRRQDGKVAGVTMLALDVTVQRRLEQELQRAQRLELVGRLASGIAHDFNNLLTVVLTLSDLAKTHLPAEHPVRDDLRRIGEAGEQAARLAGQLLAISKQRQVTTRAVEVNAVVGRTLDLLRSTLPAAITLEADLGAAGLTVRADETQLQQVLMNLCLNARDAMPQGGRLLVQTSAEAPGGPGPGGWVRLSVGDTGSGMEEGVQAKIFDPFFSTKECGTGLGLAVVQQIVENFGGRIEVWSQPGRGTRFDVWLPRAEAEQPSSPV